MLKMSKITFTRTDYVLQEFRRMKHDFDLTPEQEKQLIDIITKFKWEELKQGTYKITLIDMIHCIADKEIMPYIISLFEQLHKKFWIKSEEIDTARRAVQNTNWIGVNPVEYRSMINDIIIKTIADK